VAAPGAKLLFVIAGMLEMWFGQLLEMSDMMFGDEGCMHKM